MAADDHYLGNLRGTRRSALKVGSADLNASGLTAARTATLPDKSGTLAMLDDVGGSGPDYNIDGGTPSTVYGGSMTIDAGGP